MFFEDFGLSESFSAAFDKLGVTGSSPVSPIDRKPPVMPSLDHLLAVGRTQSNSSDSRGPYQFPAAGTGNLVCYRVTASRAKRDRLSQLRPRPWIDERLKTVAGMVKARSRRKLTLSSGRLAVGIAVAINATDVLRVKGRFKAVWPAPN
jgi:hypothetical protein